MMVRDQACYAFAPAEGVFEPRHMVGDSVEEGELAGYLHFRRGYRPSSDRGAL
jgi:N-alpha-acetyl-L-2,4-diaminobutyrate deacetylase